MAERKVEVAIQARDEASQVLKNIVGVFGAAAKSTEQFTEDLAKTDSQFKRLADASKSLRTVAETIKSLGAEAGKFKTLSDQLGKLTEKLTTAGQTVSQNKAAQEKAAGAAEQAAAKYRQLQAALRALNDEQASVIARQGQLTKTLSAAAKFDKLSQSAAEYEASLAKIGAANDELVSKQKTLQRQIEVLNTAMLGTRGSAEVTKILSDQRAQIQKELNAVSKQVDSGAKSQGSFETKLAGVIEKLNKLGEAAKASGVDVRELVRPIADLEAELAQVTQQAGTFEGRLAPVNGALATAKRSATETADGLKKAESALRSSQTAYDGIAKNISEVSVKLTDLRTKLDAAGVDTTDFAAAQNKLQSELEQTQQELIKTEGTAKRYAAAQRRVSDESNNFLEKGRTSLSFLQRLRGQVLSIVSAYVGLYGVINQTRKALETGSRLQGTQNTLLAATGNDQAAAAAEFQYASDLADRLGQNVLTLSDAYGKLRVASKESGISLNSTRVVFEALNESATVLRLNTEQVDRVFYAVTQIFSKGKIQAEELTGQLGDNLPGALALLAKGLGVSEAALLDQVKAGQITSASLIALALEAKNTYEAVLPEALNSSRAEFNRFNNEIIKLQSTFFESAEDSGLAKAIRNLTVELRKPELVQGIRDLGAAFVYVIENLPAFIKFLIDAAPAIAGFSFYFVGTKLVNGIINTAVALRTQFVVSANAATAASVRLAAGLQLALGWIGLIGAAIYTLWNESETFRKGVFAFITQVNKGWNGAVAYAEIFKLEIEKIFFSIYGIVLEKSKLSKALMLDFFGFDDAAEKARRDASVFGDSIVAEFDRIDRQIAERKAKLASDNGLIDEAATQFFIDNTADMNQPAPAQAPPASTTDPVAAKLELDRKTKEAELKRLLEEGDKLLEDANKKRLAREKKAGEDRLRLIEDVQKTILQGEQDVATEMANLSGKPQEILAAGLRAIEVKYKETYDKIAQIKGKEGEEAKRRLDAIVASEQAALRAQAETRGGLVTELQDALLEATGRGVEVELAKLKAEYDRTVAILKQTGQTEGIAIATNLFNVESAKVRLNQMLTDYDAVMSKYQADTQALADQVEIGDKTQIEAQQQQNQLRATALAQVQAMIPLMDALAKKIGDPAITAKVREVTDSLAELRRTGIERTVVELRESFASGLTNALDQWIMGVSSAKEAFAAFAADFLRRIAQMIIQQQILNFLQQSSGANGFFGAIAKAAGFHTGGVIGQDSGTPRYVNPAIFAAATRYHTGGMVGLRADEVPAILQRGEEVLSRSDPRNAMNGGGASQPVQVKVVNTIDSGDFVTQGLSTARGQEAVLNVIRANRGAL